MDAFKQLQVLKQKKSALTEEANAILAAAETQDGLLTEDQVKSVNEKHEQQVKINENIDLFMKQIEMQRGSEAIKELQATEEKQLGAPVQTPKVFENFGEQLIAIAMADRPNGVVDDRLNQIQASLGMNTAVGGDGGFLVQTDFANEVFKIAFETGILAGRCREIEIGANSNALEIPYIKESSRVNGSRWGGVQVYRVAEGNAVTATKPTIGKHRIELEKMMGTSYATEEMLRDSTLMTSFMTQAFGEEFGYELDNEIINGNGAGECLGILNSNALVAVAKATGQEADTVLAENVNAMYHRFLPRNRANAVWLVNPDVEAQFDEMVLPIGTGGVPVYLPAGGYADSPYSRLKGRPVLPVEQCAALGDQGDVILADLSQYALIRKGRLQQATSMHVRFLYDEMTFRFTMRVNGQPMLHSAITPANGTNTRSAFVTLAARA